MRTLSILLSVLALIPAAAMAQDQPVWPEHPRPDFTRSPWVNLNGPWQFAFDPDDAFDPVTVDTEASDTDRVTLRWKNPPWPPLRKGGKIG